MKALTGDPEAYALWKEITPSARWDWIRWVRAVKTPETRQKHIRVALDKLNKGMRRPCCFNRNLCSEPHVSHNWALLEPEVSAAEGGDEVTNRDVDFKTGDEIRNTEENGRQK